MLSLEQCPCGSGESYENCCGVYHNDVTLIKTCKQLLLARYSAFVLQYPDFIQLTMIEPALEHFVADDILKSPIQWHSIEILNIVDGEENDSEGKIDFRVICTESVDVTNKFAVRETSLFKKVDNQWFYADALKIAREVLY